MLPGFWHVFRVAVFAVRLPASEHFLRKDRGRGAAGASRRSARVSVPHAVRAAPRARGARHGMGGGRASVSEAARNGLGGVVPALSFIVFAAIDRHRIYTASNVLVGGDYMAMHRFFVPVLPFMYLLFGLLVSALYARIARPANAFGFWVSSPSSRSQRSSRPRLSNGRFLRRLRSSMATTAACRSSGGMSRG